MSVSRDGVSGQSLGQGQSLVSAGSDVVEGLREEHHGGAALPGRLHKPLADREVGLLVRRGRHLTYSSHWV